MNIDMQHFRTYLIGRLKEMMDEEWIYVDVSLFPFRYFVPTTTHRTVRTFIALV